MGPIQGKAFVPQATALGQTAVEIETPEVQISARYNSFRKTSNIVIGTGSISIDNSEYLLDSGVGAFGLAALFSERQLIMKSGQGGIVRLGARFDVPQTNNTQLTGASSAGDGAFFAYQGLVFGVEYRHGGAVQIQELTFTVSAGGAETADVVINGTTYPISFTATTLAQTAGQVAAALNVAVANYNFTANGSQVVMRSVFAAPSTGVFTYTATGGGAAVGAFAQVALGTAIISEFTPQADWNVDKLPDLNPQKNNQYTITFDGDLSYYVDVTGKGRILVHREGHPNTQEAPLFGVGTFRLVWGSSNGASSPASTVTIAGCNAGAFVQGRVVTTEDTVATSNTKASVGTTATNIITLRCREVFGAGVNLGRILPVTLNAFTDGAKGAILEVFKNADVAGVPNFSYLNKEDSIVEIDIAGTDVTGGTLIDSSVVTSSGVMVNFVDLHEHILAGDTFTVSMRVPSASAADMTVSINWDEEL